MKSAILLHYRYHDREGILPINTFLYPEEASTGYLGALTYQVEAITQKLVGKTFENQTFWLIDVAEFDQEEEEGYGFVYANQLKNEHIHLSADVNIAAKTVVHSLIDNGFWETYIDGGSYPLNGSSLEELSSEQPSVDNAIPTDTRFKLNETVIDSYGQRYIYQGIAYNSTSPEYDATEINRSDNTVKISINNENFVTETVLKGFLAENKINIYPLPSIALRILPKGSKWFACHKDYKKLEGYGKTQAVAKESLALKILLA